MQVEGLQGTTGTYLVGFYLPGDVAGTGQVTQADLKTIKEDKGMTAENSNYNFDADVNRDGVINGKDEQLARQNLGASTAVSPVVSVNLDPASNPALDGTTPFSSVTYMGNATPGASITFLDQASGVKTTTTAATGTGAYTIAVPLVTGSNTFSVTTNDAFGQSITGAITPVVYSPSSCDGTDFQLISTWRLEPRTGSRGGPGNAIVSPAFARLTRSDLSLFPGAVR